MAANKAGSLQADAAARVGCHFFRSGDVGLIEGLPGPSAVTQREDSQLGRDPQ